MAYRKYSSNSARGRNKRTCYGFKNWDTWHSGVVISNDKKCYDYVCNNKSKLLKMKKNEKLQAIARHSNYPKLGGVSYRNVDYKQLNDMIRYIDD